MGVIDTIKERPMLAGGVALAAIVVVILFVGIGGDEEAAPQAMSSVETGNALLAANQQAQTELAGWAMQLEGLKISEANELKLEELRVNSINVANQLAADVERQKVAAALQAGTLESTLLAQLETNRINASKEVSLAGTNAQLEFERIRAAENAATLGFLVHQANLASAERTHANNLQASILMQQFSVMSQIQAQQAAQNQANMELQARMRWG